MDFDCLTRKELQFLCKRNKIPANITNVAMADALKALEIVEGLEEFKNQSQSPEKIMNKTSQEIPSTIFRTSTRRKPTKEEHQTAQSTVPTRKTTRRTAELDEENKNLNVTETETPAVTTNTSKRAKKTEPEVKDQRKSDLVETPALQSGRRKPGVGSTRRKVEDTLQTGYGTRRSVRLLEKCMEGLSLKESEKMEPLKVNEMVEGEVQNNNGQSEELPLARNLSASLEDERDLKDDVEENSKCENGGSNGTLISLNEKIDEPEGPKGCDDNAVFEDLYETVSTPNEELVADETNDAAVSEELVADETNDAVVSEELMADETNDAAVSQELAADGTNDAAVSEVAPEIESLPEKSVADDTDDVVVSREELVVDKPEVLVANAEDISEEVLDHSSPVEAVSVEEHANQAPQEIEAVHDDLTILPKAEEYAEGEVSQDVPSVLPEDHMDSSAKKGNEASYDDHELLGDSDIDVEECDDPVTNMVDEESDDDVLGDSDIDDESVADEDLMTNVVNEEALVDANVTEAETIPVNSFHNASQSVVDDDIQVQDPEELIDVSVKPEVEFGETTEIITTTTSIPLPSPLKPQLSQPRKSSSKKQTTIPKENINKENIDVVKKVKKNKNVIDEGTMQNLEDLSLRKLMKLTKMFNKLEINDKMKNKEDDNLNKQPFGKSRTALQSLPQNCMNNEEAEKQN
ncbi:hypothetical protein ERO13_A08G223300v2 [Gossypium hirsutum]|uniref:Uncharacterized protein isoform X1 n=1 Tax=Gossypium hirsutum TaxID=3635 RepID=A0ABM2YP25_GOSHI|nr:uncharacterized protein LOC121204748 isoform X1 [Gossypium hirsutum]KAG4189444.1 hypothetical protein ERO13_A08G223300v2 [Gossypium hirsutum]